MNYQISRYGWLPDLPDHRDHYYAAVVEKAAALPASVDLRAQCPPVYDQGQLGSCTANAIAGAYAERSPVVVINGGPDQSSIDELNTYGILFSHSIGSPHTDLDVFTSITGFADRVTSAAAVRLRPTARSVARRRLRLLGDSGLLHIASHLSHCITPFTFASVGHFCLCVCPCS